MEQSVDVPCPPLPQRMERRMAWAFLHSRHAPFITHFSLIGLTGALFAILLWCPFWAAALPCVVIHSRIGVLLHEYLHGIPFRRYRDNLRVLYVFEGILISFGLFELFRGTHLAHHRWLNTENDGGFRSARSHRSRRSLLRLVWALEGFQHLGYLYEVVRGGHHYAKGRRIAVGAALSLVSMALWIAVGSAWVILFLVALNLYNGLVTSSLRGAVEHHSYTGDACFANDYKVWIPLFNLNRHVHHHVDPICPWYLLEFRTERPLPRICYFTHWYHVYVKRDYMLMQPPRREA